MKPIFSEIQRFRQWWLWVILLFSCGIPLYMILNDENLSITTTDSIFTIIILSTVIIIFALSKIETTITTKEINLKYIPFVNKTFQMEEIEFITVIDYGFVGGWGIRLWTQYGTVYNTNGSKGLHIKLKNGKRYVIGTQRPEELQKIVKQIKP